MAITINTRDRYLIKGKIVDIPGDGTLVIFVTDPFSSKIEFTCFPMQYNYIHSSRLSKYNWLGLGRGSHPQAWEASAYYNTEQKSFYKKESDSESNGESEWKVADFEDIYRDNSRLLTNDLHSYQKEHKFFVDRYIPILQKEQPCKFSAYALQEINEGNWQSVNSSQVERYPNDRDYLWIYNPDTFRGKKWDTESIDDLVKEVRPSKGCVKQLLKSYEDDDRKAKKEQRNKVWETIKSTPKRFEDFLGKYKQSTIGLGGVIVGAILAIVALLTYFKQYMP